MKANGFKVLRLGTWKRGPLNALCIVFERQASAANAWRITAPQQRHHVNVNDSSTRILMYTAVSRVLLLLLLLLLQ